MRNDTP